MESILGWLGRSANAVQAITALALTIFAGVQVWLEVRRGSAHRAAARIQAHAPAWLARRTLELAVRRAAPANSPVAWAREFGDAPRLDRLEEQMLRCLNVAAEAGGDTKRDATEAYSCFLAYADRVNELSAYQFSDSDVYGANQPPLAEMERANQLIREAVSEARIAAECLAKLAPRAKHESSLPEIVPVQMALPGASRSGPKDDHQLT